MALLNLTNFDDHPEDPLWMVFRFPDQRQASEFIAGLNTADIPFETDPHGGPPFLVGVKQRHREQAVRVNYTVIGRYRSRFMADGLLRWSVLILVGLLVLVAIIGAVLQ